MLLKQEVDITEEGISLIKDTFKGYKKVELINKISGRCIIHLYPKEDTIDEHSDNLNGYIDAVLFEAKIYDCRNLEYCTVRDRDSVYSSVPYETRIFKDLSTMLIFDGGVKIEYFTDINISALKR